MDQHNHSDDICAPDCPLFECVEGCGCSGDPLVKKQDEERRKQAAQIKRANEAIFLMTMLGGTP